MGRMCSVTRWPCLFSKVASRVMRLCLDMRSSTMPITTLPPQRLAPACLLRTWPVSNGGGEEAGLVGHAHMKIP